MCIKCVRVCALQCVRVRVCAGACAAAESPAATSRVACRTTARCNQCTAPPGTRARCGFVLRCTRYAALHAANGFGGGGPRSNPYRVSKSKLAGTKSIARAARRVVGRCCARPTCTRPGRWALLHSFWKASLSIELPLTAHGPIHPQVSSRPQPLVNQVIMVR